MPYPNNKCADQPAHPRSLISAFFVRCLDSIINTSTCYSRNFKSLSGLISWADRFESYLVANPEDRFCPDVAQIVMHPKDAEGKANSEDPDQTELSDLDLHRAVWSVSTVFAVDPDHLHCLPCPKITGIITVTVLWYLSRSMTKPTKWHVHPAKTQISLGICLVWSESSRCAQWKGKDLKVSSCRQQRLWSEWADAQADLSQRWPHMSFCWFCHVQAHFIKSISLLD